MSILFTSSNHEISVKIALRKQAIRHLKKNRYYTRAMLETLFGKKLVEETYPSLLKKCLLCKEDFLPRNNEQKICGVKCRVEHSLKKVQILN